MDKRDLVCHRCHLIYDGGLGVSSCDLCGGKLRISDDLMNLEESWARQERRLGLSSDFAYHHNESSVFLLSVIMRLWDKIPSLAAYI